MRAFLILALLALPASAGTILDGILSDGVGSDRLCWIGISSVSRIAHGMDRTHGDESGADSGKFCNGSRLKGSTIDGCDFYRWSDLDGASDEYCFTNLEVEVDEFDPDAYVVMVAFKALGAPNEMTQSEVLTGIGTLRGRIDAMYAQASTRGTDALFILIGMPRFDSLGAEACPAVAANYHTWDDTWSIVRNIANDPACGRCIVGPGTTHLNVDNVKADFCHQLQPSVEDQDAEIIWGFLNQEQAVALP